MTYTLFFLLLNLALHIMCLISPYTRTLTKDLYNVVLPYLIFTVSQIFWFCLGHEHPELDKLAHEVREAELIRTYEARETELVNDLAAARHESAHHVAACLKLRESRRTLLTEQKHFNTEIGRLERETCEAMDRARHSEGTAVGETVADLKQTVEYLRKWVSELESMLTKRDRRTKELEADLKAGKKHWEASDEYVKEYRSNGEDALRKEIYNLTMENRRMQRANFEQAQKVAAFERVLDVLHDMARQDGTGAERLPVAVGFAMTLKRAGVDLRMVQVDERRLEVLRDFVARGMGTNLPVQPQGEYKGFRTCEEFARMY